MKKSFIISWCIVFVMFFIAPHFIYPFVSQSETENTENRNMAQFPEMTLSSIEKFPADFEAYYNDTLPFRSQFIKINSVANYLLFKEPSDVSKVIIGNDNWLFYNPKGTDGDPIADFKGENLLTDEELKAMAEHLTDIDRALAKRGKEFVIMIAPNKESVYGDKYLPDIYKTQTDCTTADQVVKYLENNTELRIVYPKDALLNAIEKYPQYDFYFNTDTHWNDIGGYIGAKALADELGCNMKDISDIDIVHHGVLEYGYDLSNMMGMGDFILEENSYTVSAETDVEFLTAEKDFFTVFRFKTTSPNEKKLLIIRDSFGTAMAEYIAVNYKRSVMIYDKAYTPDAIDEENADIVVYEVVERYLRNLLTCEVV